MANPALVLDHATGGLAADLVQLIDLTDELRQVVGEENALLAGGAFLPVMTTSRKASLAMKVEALSRATHADPFGLVDLSADLRRRLEASSAALGEALQENVVRIRAAMGAASLRVDAVMHAVRGKAETDTGYGANGRLQTIVRQPLSGRLA